ncbi:MAG: TIM barrel protein [Nanohaloarchaea archaeon]|nr:TIM barrel protein [Candidatus Nanohaloarchaea archaeon]
MDVNVGISGIPLSAKGSDTGSGLRVLKKLGLDLMEIQFSRNIYLNSDSARTVGNIAKELGIGLTCHASYYINLASQKKEVQDASVKRIVDTLIVAETLRAKLIVVHAGYYSGRSHEDAYDIIKSNIDVIGTKCPSKVKIGIETMGRQKSFGTVDEVIRLCNDCPNVYPVIDFGHIHARNFGNINTVCDFTSIFEKFENETGINRFHIHMSCMRHANGNEISHLPLDSFDPDFRLMAKSINDNGYKCSVVCESPRLEQDALLFRSWLKS